jgi:hypothetical protein
VDAAGVAVDAVGGVGRTETVQLEGAWEGTAAVGPRSTFVCSVAVGGVALRTCGVARVQRGMQLMQES